MPGNNSEQEKWKYKYLETLEELEEKERAWRVTDESLRHGLSRLALVSTGLNPGLDAQLKKLRRALQDQVQSNYLDEIVNKISSYLKTLDEQGRIEATAPSQTPLDLLIGIVDAIEFPRQYQQQLKRLHRALNSRDADQHIDRLVNEFTKLVEAAFYPEDNEKQAGVDHVGKEDHSAEQEDAQEKSSWWNKIFSGNEKDQATSAPDQQVESQIELEDDQPTRTAESTVEHQPTSQGTGGAPVQVDHRALEMALLSFIEHLAFPPQFRERVQLIRDQLVEGLTGHGVRTVISGLVTLVTDVQQQLQREKEELEVFLKQLGQRLQELDAMVDGAETHRLASLVSGRELDKMVAAQVNDIEQTVQSVAEVSQMKGLIQGSLDNIRQHLAEQRQQEECRQEELEMQLKSLNKRLAEMEGESKQLRKRLAQERVQAMTDPLTSVPNRLGYEKRMGQEFARWQRYDSPLSLVLCDIDHFKHINDTYGHKAGDRALMAIAKTISQHLRETDFLARIGGEEFVVLLPETPLEDAKIAAEKLRQGVEACEFVYEGKPVPITMSGGVATFHHGDTVEDVYVRADKGLYRAKQQGRNRFDAEN